MGGSRKFCQRGSNSDGFFFFGVGGGGGGLMRGKRIHIALKASHHLPPGKRHLNGISLAGRSWPNIECWLGSFVIFQGVRTSIAKKLYIFVIFQGEGGSDPCPLPGICAYQQVPLTLNIICFDEKIIYF